MTASPGRGSISLPPLLSVLILTCGVYGAATSWAGQDSAVAQQPVEPEAQDEKPGRVIFALTPLPAPDPRALALEGRPIRAITISGNRVSKEHVIRRELELHVGEPFDATTMTEDIVRLENLGIFSVVAIELADMDAGVEVDVAVREMPWIIPYPAFKVSDQDSIQVGGAVSSLNLFGLGMGVSARALFGGASTYQVGVNWPWITANHLSLELFGGHILRDDSLRGFGETSDEFTPWVGTFIGRNWEGELILVGN